MKNTSSPEAFEGALVSTQFVISSLNPEHLWLLLSDMDGHSLLVVALGFSELVLIFKNFPSQYKTQIPVFFLHTQQTKSDQNSDINSPPSVK